jgi:hypothetical protein
MAELVERAQGSRRASSMSDSAVHAGNATRRLARPEVRLFLTCWILFALHFSPFVTRELYLTMALAEEHSLYVDKYLGLHPDLFELRGRGYMGGNPGVSLLAAVPYAMLLPVIERVAPIRPARAGEQVQAETEEERAARRQFYRRIRERGIDVRLGVAAMLTATLFMAPLAAAGVVVMYRVLRRAAFAERTALWLALLFAFGTPIFFRSATMNLNLQVALLAFFAFVLLWWPAETRPEREPWRLFAAGFLAGFGVLTDYSGVVPAAALGIFAWTQQMRSRSFWPALGRSLWFLAGAAGPVLFLLWWQWTCYGNPWLPAQFHMPEIYYRGYENARGIGAPSLAAMRELLFSPLYGLVIFMPLAVVALYHFALLRRGTARVPPRAAVFIWALFAAYLIFCSAIQYTLRHQWLEGMRYMIVVVPFLFLLVADVLAQWPRGVALALGAVSAAEMTLLAMVRESPYISAVKVLTEGVQLPWLTTLSKVAAQYAPWVRGQEHWLALGMYAAAAALVGLVWTAGRSRPATAA